MQGVKDVRESEGPPVIGGIGPETGITDPKGCRLLTGTNGSEANVSA